MQREQTNLTGFKILSNKIYNLAALYKFYKNNAAGIQCKRRKAEHIAGEHKQAGREKKALTVIFFTKRSVNCSILPLVNCFDRQFTGNIPVGRQIPAPVNHFEIY